MLPISQHVGIMMLHYFNDAVSDIESDTKLNNYVIISILKSEPMFKIDK